MANSRRCRDQAGTLHLNGQDIGSSNSPLGLKGTLVSNTSTGGGVSPALSGNVTLNGIVLERARSPATSRSSAAATPAGRGNVLLHAHKVECPLFHSLFHPFPPPLLDNYQLTVKNVVPPDAPRHVVGWVEFTRQRLVDKKK